MHTCFYHALASCRIALIGASLAFCLPAHAATQKKVDFSLSEAKPLPQVPFLSIDGKKTNLSQQKGRIKALHYWATWCVPCIKELPEINELQKEYEGHGLNIIAISMDGANNTAKVKDYLAKNNLKNLNVFIDDNTAAFRAVEAAGMPTTIFIDEQGQEIARITGVMDWQSQKLHRFLDKSLGGQ